MPPATFSNCRLVEEVILISPLFFFFFDLAPGIQSFTPTTLEGAQALNKESLTSTPRLIQRANPQSDGPKN